MNQNFGWACEKWLHGAQVPTCNADEKDERFSVCRGLVFSYPLTYLTQTSNRKGELDRAHIRMEAPQVGKAPNFANKRDRETKKGSAERGRV